MRYFVSNNGIKTSEQLIEECELVLRAPDEEPLRKVAILGYRQYAAAQGYVPRTRARSVMEKMYAAVSYAGFTGPVFDVSSHDRANIYWDVAHCYEGLVLRTNTGVVPKFLTRSRSRLLPFGFWARRYILPLVPND